MRATLVVRTFLFQEGMFSDVGGKIKTIAKIIFVLQIILPTIIGVSIIHASVDLIGLFLGIALLFGGPLIVWLDTILLYGFGELIENCWKSAVNTRDILDMMYKQKRSE